MAAGPLPEAIAIVERCALAGVETGRIEVDVFDIAADAWRHAASESVAIAKRLSPGLQVDWQYYSTDLRLQTELAAKYDVIVLQHCVNEICHDRTPTSGMLSVVGGVRDGGYLAIVDFSKYPAITAAVQRMEKHLVTQGWTKIKSFDPEFEEETPFLRVPRETFFAFYGMARDQNGLWLEPRIKRRKNLRYSWSTWHRKCAASVAWIGLTRDALKKCRATKPTRIFRRIEERGRSNAVAL